MDYNEAQALSIKHGLEVIETSALSTVKITAIAGPGEDLGIAKCTGLDNSACGTNSDVCA